MEVSQTYRNWAIQQRAESSMGIGRTRQLISSLDLQKVERITHLGNRIVGYNAGKRFELR